MKISKTGRAKSEGDLYHYTRSAYAGRYRNNIPTNKNKYLLDDPRIKTNTRYVIKHYINLELDIEKIHDEKEYRFLYHYLKDDWVNMIIKDRSFHYSFISFIKQYTHQRKVSRSNKGMVNLVDRLLNFVVNNMPIKLEGGTFGLNYNVMLDHDFVENYDFYVPIAGRDILEEVFVFNNILEMYEGYKEGIREECKYTLEQIELSIYEQLKVIIAAKHIPLIFRSILNGEIVDNLLKIKKSRIKNFTEEWNEELYLKDTNIKLYYLFYPLIIPFKLISINKEYKEKLLNEIFILANQQEPKYISKSDIQDTLSKCDKIYIDEVYGCGLQRLLDKDERYSGDDPDHDYLLHLLD